MKTIPTTIGPRLTQLLFDYVFTWGGEEEAAITLGDAMSVIKTGKHLPDIPKDLRASSKVVKDVRELIREVRSRHPEAALTLHRAAPSYLSKGPGIASWTKDPGLAEEWLEAPTSSGVGARRQLLTRNIPTEDILADPEITMRYSPDEPPDTEYIVWEGA